MGGSPLKHLKMFQNLCGTEALKNVVLVTTMWDEVGEEEGSNRENELTARYWNAMIDLGCHTSRFYNNTKSASDIVSQFQLPRCSESVYSPFTKGDGGSASRIGGDVCWQDTLFFSGRVYQEVKRTPSSDRC